MRSILIAVLFLNIGLAIVSSVFCKKNRAHEEQKIEAMMRAPVEKEPREGPLCEEKIMRMESMLREAKEKSGEQVPEEYMPTVQKGPFEDKLNNPTSYYEKGHLVYKMVIPYDEYIDKVWSVCIQVSFLIIF